MRRGGQAWLLADRATLAEARRQVRGSTLWFQRLQAWYLLTAGRVSAPTVAAVAARAGLDPDRLEATLAAYNAAARDPAAPDPAGKPAAARRAQDQPPFSLIDCSVRPRLFYPAPVLTLGGLVVDPGVRAGPAPRRQSGPTASYRGRSARLYLCSRSYVSGAVPGRLRVFSGQSVPAAVRHHRAAGPPWTGDADLRSSALIRGSCVPATRAPDFVMLMVHNAKPPPGILAPASADPSLSRAALLRELGTMRM